MATRPVFQIAQDLGLPTEELLRRLRAAGISAEKSSFSLVDEEVAHRLAGPTRPVERRQGPLVLPEWMQRQPRRERAQVPPRTPPAAAESRPAPAPPLGEPPPPAHEPGPDDRRAPAQDPARAGEVARRPAPRGPVVEPPAAPPPRREAPEPRFQRPPPSEPTAPPSAPPQRVRRPGRPEPAPSRAAQQGYIYGPAQPEHVPAPGAPLGSRSDQRKRLRQLRRLRDAELSKPGGQLLARRRDAEIRALEASLGQRGAAAGERARLASVRSMSLPAAIAAVILIAGAFLLGGIRTGRENTRRVDETAAAALAFQNTVATARRPSVPIYLSEGDTSPLQTLSSPNADGAPLVFLVKQRSKRWLEVDLPTRPNGSTGWIRASDVSLTGHDYRMRIDLLSHRLTAWNGSRQIAQVPVGVGQAVTPTPSGRYYITELLKQPDPSGLYGPWAFGLSAHSDVLDEFAGADGILGIHGTDYPAGIGTDVSHGCIRMSNRNITYLAHRVPVGTPVDITRA